MSVLLAMPYYFRIGLVTLSLAAFASVLPTAHAQVFVADSASNSIARITDNGATVTQITTGLSGPTGLTFGLGGDLFVSNNSDSILRVNPITGLTSLFANVSGANASAYRASTGDLFVTTNTNPQTIIRINSQGQVFSFATVPNFAATGLAIASNGDLFISESSSSSGIASAIGRVNGTTGVASSLVSIAGTTALNGLALDSTGNLYVADGTNGSVLRVTTGATPTVATFATVGALPTGLGFLSNGNLLVARSVGNDVFQITPGGTASIYSNSVGGGPNGIAVAPSAAAPEPGSIALLALSGLPVVGMIARRRRKDA